MAKTNKNAQKKYDHIAKIIIIGNSSVGKTSILTRFTQPQHISFQLSHTPTIGVDFKTKDIVYEGKNIKLQLWDTAGQQRFRNMTKNYYTGSNGIILVFSITDRKSFQEIQEWIYQINTKTDQNTPKIIIGNKCDLGGRFTETDQKRVVEFYEGKLLAEKYKCQYLEVSAKENINISKAFTILTTKMIKSFPPTNHPKQTTELLGNKSMLERKKKCC